MILKKLALQHFRSYPQATYSFSPKTSVIIGPNTAGKSNLLEAIYLLSSGKSFRAERDTQMISFGEKIAHVKAQVGEDKEQLEVIISDRGSEADPKSFSKKFLVNGVAKRRVDFVGILPALLFAPVDLEIISSSPTHRREFLNAVLEVTDKHYRQSLIAYEKALRQRNALLGVVRETGIRNDEQFAYWDDLLIENGSYLTQKRAELIEYFNTGEKTLLSFSVTYDKSEISRERLKQYKGPEIGAGVTLVGPHRDDFFVEFTLHETKQNVKYFGSRGQQRLVVLQLKLLQLTAIEAEIGYRPLLLLDDIFSELDAEHIQDVLSIITKQQTIITTTHKEFIETVIGKDTEIIELRKKSTP